MIIMYLASRDGKLEEVNLYAVGLEILFDCFVINLLLGLIFRAA